MLIAFQRAFFKFLVVVFKFTFVFSPGPPNKGRILVQERRVGPGTGMLFI